MIKHYEIRKRIEDAVALDIVGTYGGSAVEPVYDI
jgi:hypothetical protein